MSLLASSLSAGQWLLFVLATVLPPLLVSCLAAWAIRRLAPKWGLVDQPGERKVHVSATPLGGGLAIWVGVVAVFGIAFLSVLLFEGNSQLLQTLPLGRLLERHLPGIWQKGSELAALLLGGTLLMLLGLADDFRQLNWKIRLFVQALVAAGCVAVADWKLTLFVEYPAVTTVLSILWIVTLVNVFNMLDNMDGLSAGTGIIVAVLLAAVALGQTAEATGPQLFVGAFLLVLAGSLAGFLVHNRPPARIFMGDAGSYFLGFCIAIATLLITYTNYQSPRPHAILAPLFILAVPLYDLITVLWIRLRQGRSPFEGDKSHFSHRLVQLGLGKPQAVATIWLTTASCGLAALLLHQVDFAGALVLSLIVLAILLLVAILENVRN